MEENYCVNADVDQCVVVADISAKAYFATVISLENRGDEYFTFIKRIDNCFVNWTGKVVSVTEHDDSVSIMIKNIESIHVFSVLIAVENNIKERALTLKKDDVIVVQGILNVSIPHFPQLYGSAFELKV